MPAEKKEDPLKTILTLEASNEWTAGAFRDPRNKDRYKAPDPPSDHRSVEFDSRETTPSVVSNDGDTRTDKSAITLYLDQMPKDIRRGFVFGSDPKVSDIFLGDKRHGISGRHFSITFDHQRRPVIRDTSRKGMKVSYNGQGAKQKRHNFTWILFENIEKIEVTIPKTSFQFNVVLGDHSSCETKYQSRLNLYLAEAQNFLGPINNLYLESQETTAIPSESLSPRQGPIYYKDLTLGTGQFGIVRRAFDVSTGSCYAEKQFLKGDFKKEVEIFRRLRHDYIVKFENFTDELDPCLIMEYLPLGDLPNQHRVTPIAVEETVVILHQCLQALEYLHSQDITHRDIKPNNILFESRRPFYVKLSDFGLAKGTSALRTVCGSYLYTAPEVWRGSGYTAAVDVWSLGVVAFQYAYGLPRYSRTGFDPKSWYKSLKRAVEDWDSEDFIDFLSSSMLQEDHSNRKTVAECLVQVRSLVAPLDLIHNIEVGTETPTEVVSTSLLLKARRHAEQTRNSKDVNETQLQFNHPLIASRELNESRIQTKLWGLPASKSKVSEVGGQRQPANSSAGEVIMQEGDQDRAISNSHCQAQGKSLKRPRHSASSSNASSDPKLVSSGKMPAANEFDARALKEVRPGYLEITVNGQLVTMRKVDNWLNATQILALTEKSARQREELLQHFRKRSAAEVEEATDSYSNPSSWVSLRLGQLLCETLGLEIALRPFLQYIHQQEATRNSSSCLTRELQEHIQVNCRGALVFVRKSDCRVNASQILKKAGFSRHKLQASKFGIPYDIVRGKALYQGTYVDIKNGIELCRTHNLNCLLFHLEEVIQRPRFGENIGIDKSLNGSQVARQTSPDIQPVGVEADTETDGSNVSRIEPRTNSEHEDDMSTKQPSFHTEPSCSQGQASPDSSNISQTEPRTLRTNLQHEGGTSTERPSSYIEPSYSHGSYLLPYKGPALTQVHPRLTPSPH